MKFLKYCFLLITLWLGAGRTGWAQSCLTANPPVCTFEAIDDNGLSVSVLCVGKRVRFQPCASRNPIVYGNLIRYEVLPGVGTTPPSCTPTQIYPYSYIPPPSAVGMVTVSELSNENGAKFYTRTFEVKDTSPPAFTIAPCLVGSALVTVTDTKFNSYTVQAGSGPSQAISYNQPTVVAVPAGATTITVTGRYNIPEACEGVNTQPLRAIAAPVQPVFSSLTLDATGTSTLAVSRLSADYRYTLQKKDGSGTFRDVQPPVPVDPNSPSIGPLVLAPGCYRIARTDLCGGSFDASPPICTLSLTVTSTNNRNQLLLDDAGNNNPSTYTVTRNGQPISTLTPIAGGLEDADVQCGSTYTYVVTAPQPGGGVAVSNPRSIKTESLLPPPPPKLVASFNLRNVVELTPLLTPPALPAGASLRYFRTTGLATVSFDSVTTLRAPRDSAGLDALRADRPCYTVRLRDVCNNASPLSAPACPSLLTASAAGPDGTAATITWTPFSGPDPGQPATYVLLRLGPDGTVRSNQPVSGTTYTDLVPPTDQTVRYRLQISGAGLPAGTFSYSNLAGVTRAPSLAIPTAFTPNGDGLNDVLEVKGRFLSNYTFVVVDRNGQEVFRGTQRSDVWDGRIAGRAPVPGSYVWRFQQATDDGQLFVRSGAVTILR